MARTDTLPHFLTDVADAIRTKGGTSETIQASSFDTAISNLPSGGADLSEYFNNAPTATYNNAKQLIKKIPMFTLINNNMNNFFDGMTGLEEISLIDTSNVETMYQTFVNCSSLTTIPLLNTANVLSFQSCFQNSGITTIPLIDTSKCTNFNGMFSNCKSLISIPQIDTSTGTTFTSFLSNANNVTTIPILDLSSATTLNSMFYGCWSLTDTSLDNILQMCIGATSYTGTKTLATLSLNSSLYPASRIEALPHYSDFTTAGWTIGY